MSEYRSDNRNQAASLGCGTLIIIALIVVFLGRSDTTPLEAEIASLREEVAALQNQQSESHRLLETLILRAESP